MRILKILLLIFTIIITAALSDGMARQSETDGDISWLAMEEAQQHAEDDGKPLFVFVEAEWCGICKRMLSNVFPERAVREDLVENYHPVMIDLDSKNKIRFNGETMTERDFARKMKVTGTPTTFFFDSSGEELGRQVGFIGSEELQRLLVYVNSERFNEVSFEEFEGDR